MRQLDGLDKALYDSGMGLVVLPQLDAVKKEAAIEWLRDDCKHHLMLGYETLKDRETKIRQLYEGQAHGISMEILASQLKDILQETTV